MPQARIMQYSGRRLQPALALGVCLVLGACHRDDAVSYLTEEVKRLTLRENISATGEVSARVKVNVGSQVSGTVARVHVDFNSHVKKGDLLAELDPRLFEAQLARSDASVAVADAEVEKSRITLKDAERTLRRNDDLLNSKMIAQADYDTAQMQRDAARAALRASEALLQQAEADRKQAVTNLAFTKIRSPIDGVVIDRQVDAGQTVAAQFQVATLFVIANDMRHVRILADIDEADVGRVHDAMPVQFTVDAYPHTVFKGVIRALRQAPTTAQSTGTGTSTSASTSNVVTYAADIDADNPNGQLRQGMTAQVTVLVAEHTDVLTMPNSALRYRPKAGDKGTQVKKPPHDPKAQAATPLDNLRRGRVYVLVEGQAHPQEVRLGSSDGHRTEVQEGLQEGDRIITGEVDSTPGGRRGFF